MRSCGGVGSLFDVLNLQTLKIGPFVDLLASGYEATFGTTYPEYVDLLRLAANLGLENIANGDMLYHDVDHTIMVTMVGQELLRCKRLKEGGVTPEEGLNYLVSLLCHDVGYVKGVCEKDGTSAGGFDDGRGSTVFIPEGGTCARLAPHHVDRSKVFVRERFSQHDFLNVDLMEACIERTRFPVPDDEVYFETEDLPGLTRAADLVGQLGDPEYLRKIPALYYEFHELGADEDPALSSPGAMRKGYAQFFWGVVHGYVEYALNLLRVTQEGKEWISRLHSHVFECEHYLGDANLGAEAPV